VIVWIVVLGASCAFYAEDVADERLFASNSEHIVLGRLFGLSAFCYAVVILFAALPTASSAHMLTMRMGGDGRSMA
jgi:hypothetical protein